MEQVGLSALAALALFLTAGTVASELGTALWTPPPTAETPERGPEDGPEAAAFVEVALEHTDRVTANGTDGVVCVPGRTLTTTYRPALLLERPETGCGAEESVLVSLYLQGAEPFSIGARRVDVCPASGYTITQVRHGDRLSGVRSEACHLVIDDPATRLDAEQHRWTLDTRIRESWFYTTGLHVVCTATEVTLGDGSRHVLEDLTWFEVWKADEAPPNRAPHLQSIATGTACSLLGIPFEHGLGDASG